MRTPEDFIINGKLITILTTYSFLIDKDKNFFAKGFFEVMANIIKQNQNFRRKDYRTTYINAETRQCFLRTAEPLVNVVIIRQKVPKDSLAASD